MQYRSAEDFHEGLGRVLKTVADRTFEYRFINPVGKVVVLPPKAAGATRNYSEGLALVEMQYARVYIDKTGKTIIKRTQDKFVGCPDFHEGLAVFRQ